ncbi:N-acetyltransferase [Paractinoplanes abujensis]|uniref:Ribosomal protein S18 acetylase RimI-like enzyme n=1 Tax=Paractinoplanes abujensis TaxID=882441 RepID=A0A7W7G4P4_9ACTN|nr:GNAT family N-acetyltransferase [Actinoplanes abujensis]MBB4695844.1 ribosomal protein S18 acetylase RimI-like enzyme [Actinoplanes abujensis]GID23432.1 N-acetyltransferase [Actinoplanes abujensis]
MSSVIVGAAESSQLSDVLRFWLTAAENEGRPADTPAALAALHLRDPDALIVALDGERIVGTVIAGWDGWRCHLYRLAVAPDRRREGIGAALVEAAERRFRALGGTRVDAMVLDGNERAHAIWAARGYHRQDDWSRWVKPLR